jgi:2',3'-cyclic-nucleotide 2'-phosphodiesterase (5'-nucleotidase family)
MLLAGATIPIVMSHAGLKADRAILPLVPDGTLFAGAHDHLRLVHADAHAVYFHSGSWNEYASIARLHFAGTPARPLWEVEQVRIADAAPADPALAALIRDTVAHNLQPEDQVVLGHTEHALPAEEAARFAVEAVRRTARADVAIIGATTFGGGLPAGEVTRFALDGCVRFDGTIYAGEIGGARLQQLLARCNQGPDTPFAARTGENLVATVAGEIVPGRTYRIATTDWLAKNPQAYFGPGEIALAPRPELKLKAVVAAALSR